jgi:hypothetical protein
MKSPIQSAFFMAMPLEAANMYFRDSFAYIRTSLGGISLGKLLDSQFEIIHWPGLYLADWFDRVGFPLLGLIATAVCGYLDTVILLIAVIFVSGSLGGQGVRRPSRPDHSTEI